MKKTPDKTGQKQAVKKRDKKGRFVSGVTGNPAGRPVGTGKAGKLAKALEDFESETGKSFVRHYIKLAFQDPQTARDFAGRLWPSLKAVEGDLDINQKVSGLADLIRLACTNSDGANNGNK